MLRARGALRCYARALFRGKTTLLLFSVLRWPALLLSITLLRHRPVL